MAKKGKYFSIPASFSLHCHPARACSRNEGTSCTQQEMIYRERERERGGEARFEYIHIGIYTGIRQAVKVLVVDFRL